MQQSVKIEALQREVRDVVRMNPRLSPDNAFVHWFLSAYLGIDKPDQSILGGAGDKGIDAVWVDHKNRKAYIVQGKYRTSEKSSTESHPHVISFAGLARLLTGNGQELMSLLKNADVAVQDRLQDVQRMIQKRKYELDLYFVSTGRISRSLEEEAERSVEAASETAHFRAFGRERVLALLQDYLDGVAPPVQSLDLIMDSEDRVKSGGATRRFDALTGTEAWVFSMLASDVGDLYRHAGVRLFARNVRGFLGSTEINRQMRNSLRRVPENFWYFNNGITLICDAARMIEHRGKQVLRVLHPQIINGQQTTRVLSEYDSRKASVLVRAIAIPRDDEARFETLVSSIVAATNSQNKVKQSDLRANDAEQIRIDREFRRLGYQYLRKRQTKGETKLIFGVTARHQIKKEEIAQAVSAGEFDPASPLLGTDRLFEEEFYHKIFDRRQAKDYLTLVWLSRVVGWTAKGGERRYARWLVLNQVWRWLKPSVASEPARANFLRICEHEWDSARFRPLDRCVESLTKGALAFFKANRGKGRKALDAFAFFKSPHLSDKFDTFQQSSAGRLYRRRASTHLKRFIEDLSKVES